MGAEAVAGVSPEPGSMSLSTDQRPRGRCGTPSWASIFGGSRDPVIFRVSRLTPESSPAGGTC